MTGGGNVMSAQVESPEKAGGWGEGGKGGGGVSVLREQERKGRSGSRSGGRCGGSRHIRFNRCHRHQQGN